MSATSIKVTVDEEKQRVVLSHSGEINVTNAIQAYTDMYNANGFDPSFDAIIDYSGLSKVNLSFMDLKTLSGHFNKIDDRTGNNAFVVGNDIGRLTFASLYTRIRNMVPGNQSRYKAFKTIPEADNWLENKKKNPG